MPINRRMKSVLMWLFHTYLPVFPAPRKEGRKERKREREGGRKEEEKKKPREKNYWQENSVIIAINIRENQIRDKILSQLLRFYNLYVTKSTLKLIFILYFLIFSVILAFVSVFKVMLSLLPPSVTENSVYSFGEHGIAKFLISLAALGLIFLLLLFCLESTFWSLKNFFFHKIVFAVYKIFRKRKKVSNIPLDTTQRKFSVRPEHIKLLIHISVFDKEKIIQLYQDLPGTNLNHRSFILVWISGSKLWMLCQEENNTFKQFLL